jgi:O-antigen ligase
LTLVVPVALTWAALADAGLDRRLTAGINEASADQPARTELWTVAANMLRDHPWLGVGPDNFRWEFAAYSGLPADNLGIHAHDQYLETLADTGVLGLVSFLWLITALVRLGLDRARQTVGDWPWRAALLASLAAWLAHALLDDFERFWPTSVAFWLVAGLTLARGQRWSSSAVQEPIHRGDDRDDHQDGQDAGRAGQRRAAATAAETHHSVAIVVASAVAFKN